MYKHDVGRDMSSATVADILAQALHAAENDVGGLAPELQMMPVAEHNFFNGTPVEYSQTLYASFAQLYKACACIGSCH